MSKETIKKMSVDGEYDTEGTNYQRGFIASAFKERPQPSMIILLIPLILFMVIAIGVAVLFIKTDETQKMILYAAILTICAVIVTSATVFVWQKLSRRNIKREIRRLELLITELADVIGHKE